MSRSIKNILPIPGFQLRFILLGYISGLVLAALYLGTFYFYIKENYLNILEISNLPLETKLAMGSDMERVIYGLILISAIFIVVVVFVCLYFSHKVAGPIAKLMRSMDDILQDKGGDKISFRKKDEFQELASTFNKVLEHMNIKNKE